MAIYPVSESKATSDQAAVLTVAKLIKDLQNRLAVRSSEVAELRYRKGQLEETIRKESEHYHKQLEEAKAAQTFYRRALLVEFCNYFCDVLSDQPLGDEWTLDQMLAAADAFLKERPHPPWKELNHDQ